MFATSPTRDRRPRELLLLVVVIVVVVVALLFLFPFLLPFLLSLVVRRCCSAVVGYLERSSDR
jgi:predicted PurR-regulated permease PerM